MSSIPADAHSHVAHVEHAHHGSFLTTYVFSRDHKIIGLQFLFSTLLWFLIGGLLALAVRWQLAYPWSDLPILGRLLAPEMLAAVFTQCDIGRAMPSMSAVSGASCCRW